MLRCLICDSTDQWKEVTEHRIKPIKMHICKKCGFVTYAEGKAVQGKGGWKYLKTEEEVRDFYKADYRPPPQANNLFTCQKKNMYHEAFLKDTFKKWRKEGKEKPVVCDVGAAYGVFLAWVRNAFPEADINGTEWTLSFRRNAFHEFGIKLSEDFDYSKKYDLITSYKVAEHQLDVDKYLIKYKECLKEDGLMYISVPTWFKYLYNFGTNSMDLEYYYHPDHINVWTKDLFERLLAKCGLEIVKHNGTYYDDTYLCKRNDDLMGQAVKDEDHEQIIDTMKKMKEAWIAFDKNDFQKCVEIWPRSPIAWRGYYERNRAAAHKKGFEHIKVNFLNPALEHNQDIADTWIFAAEISMRYEQFEMAIQYLKNANELKPKSAMILDMRAQCFRQMAQRATDPKEQVELIQSARDSMRYLLTISEQGREAAINWIYSDNANIPFEGE